MIHDTEVFPGTTGLRDPWSVAGANLNFEAVQVALHAQHAEGTPFSIEDARKLIDLREKLPKKSGTLPASDNSRRLNVGIGVLPVSVCEGSLM